MGGLALNLPPGDPQPRYTYSTIGLYRAAQVSAEIYTGRWTDVGTPQRLAQLNDAAA